MNNANFPGFEGDDQPAQPKPPAKNPPAAPAYSFEDAPTQPLPAPAPGKAPAPLKPGERGKAAAKPPVKSAAPPAAAFNPFDTPVDVSPAALAAAPPAVAAGASAPNASVAAAQADVDADIKPGQGKDLWNCPHCGSGNKPGRTTCRACGKSPDEPVAIPWFKQPKNVGTIGGVVVLLILVFTFWPGANVTMKPADAAHLDSALRQAGGATAKDVDGRQWLGSKRVAVVGRVAAVLTHAEPATLRTVILALGKAAANDDTFATVKANFAGERPEIDSPNLNTVVLHLMPSSGALPDLKVGAILSLSGQRGTLSDGGRSILALDDSLPTILVEAFEVSGQ